jgi:hypothetical protein
VAANYALPSGLTVDTLPPTQDPTTTSSGTGTTTSTAPPSSSVPNGDPALSTGAIVGIAVGGAVGLAAFGIIVFLLLRRKRRAGSKSFRGDGRLDMVSEDKEPPRVEPYTSGSFSRTPLRRSYHSQGGGLPFPQPHPSGNENDYAPTVSESDPTNQSEMSYFNLAAAPGLRSPTSPHLREGTSSFSEPSIDASPGIGPYSPGLPSSPFSSGTARSEKQLLAQTRSALPLAPSPGPSRGAYLVHAPQTTPSVSGHTGTGTESELDDAVSPSATAFRRHTDAGTVEDEGQPQQGGVVDLPPMYTDVPRRDP